MGASLEIDHLSVIYGGYRALNDVSLALEEAGYTLLVGENGAGKSTLLRCGAGWQRPTRGRVVVFGKPLERHERELRRWTKLVPDTPEFYPELTAWEHVAWVARVHGCADWEASADRWLTAFGIAANKNAYPTGFSRGMQYKLALTMALVTEPRLLLLDEPFGPLDPYSQEYLAHRLKELAASGVAILLSSHVLPESDMPSRVLVLDQGTLVDDREWSQVEQAYTGVSPTALPVRILRDVVRTRRGDA